MYKKIETIIFEKDLSKKELARKLDMSYNTLLLKLSGRYKFTFDEAIKMKEILEVDITVEELFNKTA